MFGFARVVVWRWCLAGALAIPWVVESNSAWAEADAHQEPTHVGRDGNRHSEVGGTTAPQRHAATAKGHAAESEHVPHFSDINWIYGILGERDGVVPSVLWRPTGMPVPFATTLLNWAILVTLLGMLAKKHVPGALAKRKSNIEQGMKDAATMRDDSAQRLSEYERKLQGLDQELERLKEEMRRSGEQERERILADATERRVRMERDARHLIETELENAKEELRLDLARRALLGAEQHLRGRVSTEDHSRFFDESLASLKKLPSRSLGGRS